MRVLSMLRVIAKRFLRKTLIVASSLSSALNITDFKIIDVNITYVNIIDADITGITTW